MNEIGPKQPRIRDNTYLAFVRLQPCCICGCPPPSDAAHIRMAGTIYGKRMTGAGEKPDDKWAVPLCRPTFGIRQGCHKSQHSMNESEWWHNHGINPFEVAKKLYAIGGNPDAPQPRRKPKARINPKGFGRKLQSRPFQKTKRKFGQ